MTTLQLTHKAMSQLGDHIVWNTKLGTHGLRQDATVQKSLLVVLMAFSKDIDQDEMLEHALRRLDYAIAHKINDNMVRTGETVTELVWGIGNGTVTIGEDDELMEVPEDMTPVRFEIEIGWEFNSLSMTWEGVKNATTVGGMTLNQADKWLGQSPRAGTKSDSL